MIKKVLLLTITHFSIITSNVFACSVCYYGDPTQTANVAIRNGILVMIGVVVVVLGLFGAWFLNLRSRAKIHNQN